MRRVGMLMFLVAISGCYEAIEHQAPFDGGTDAGVDAGADAGSPCTSNDQCGCNNRCLLSDAGSRCVAFVPVTCMHAPDCTTPLVCVQTHRFGHGCGYLECQP